MTRLNNFLSCSETSVQKTVRFDDESLTFTENDMNSESMRDRTRVSLDENKVAAAKAAGLNV